MPDQSLIIYRLDYLSHLSACAMRFFLLIHNADLSSYHSAVFLMLMLLRLTVAHSFIHLQFCFILVIIAVNTAMNDTTPIAAGI